MSTNSRRRVVITGTGAGTPRGTDVEVTGQNLAAGECGAAVMTPIVHSDYAVHFACQQTDFDTQFWIDHKEARRMDRFVQRVLAAARQAEPASGIDNSKEGDRI